MYTGSLISAFKFCFAGQVHAQALEGLFIHLGKDHRGVDLTATESAQLIHRLFRSGIGSSADGQSDQHFIGMQPGVAVTQVRHRATASPHQEATAPAG